MVVDELYVKKGSEFLAIDSYDNEMIDEIVYEGQSFHFAKQKDLTGTSEVVADNAVVEPIISLGVSGNTSQKTYAGYNLFNQEVMLENSGCTKAEYKGVECIKIAPTKTEYLFPLEIPAGSTFRLSFDYACPNGIDTYWYFKYDDGTRSTSFISWSNKTVKEDFVIARPSNVAETTAIGMLFNNTTKKIVGIRALFYTYTTLTPLYIKNFMVNMGTEHLPYEPYVGGIPSPNPDYPQPIENANSEGMSVVVHGYNLFNKGTVTLGKNLNVNTGTIYNSATRGVSDYIEVDASKQYTIYYSYQAPTGSIRYSCCYDANFVYLGETVRVSGTGNGDYSTYNLRAGTKYVRLNFWYDVENSIDESEGLIFYEGTEELPYEPYFREEIVIPTSVEVEGEAVPLLMSKWDKLTVDRVKNEVKYIEGSCKKVFTGEEAWAFHAVQPEYNIPNVWYRLNVSPKADVNVTTTKLGFGYSNMLGFTTANPAPNKAEWLFRFQYKNGGRLYIITPPDAELDTLDKFKAFLQEKYGNGTPLTIEYVIEPITHDITNTDLGQQLLALATHKGTNYLEIKSNLAPSQTDFSYWRQIIPNE